MTAFTTNPLIQSQIEHAAKLLRAMSVGQTLPYEAFDAERYALARARSAVEKEDGIRFATISKVGVKRLAADEVPMIGAAGTRRIHRAARKTVVRLSNLRAYNDMAPTERLAVAAHRMIATSIAEKTSRTAVREAESTVRTAGAAIDFGTILK